MTRIAREFFEQHLPFWEMESADELSRTEGVYVLAKPLEVYAVYIPSGGTAEFDFPIGAYRIRWFDPAAGGDLQQGTTPVMSGPGVRSLGNAPGDKDQDWLALVERVGR